MRRFRNQIKYIAILLLGFSGSAFVGSSGAATYKLTYTAEIYYYCIEKYGTGDSAAGDCMAKQKKMKNKILNKAKRKLGRLSLAERIYAECVDYTPRDGVKEIGKCVETRMALSGKLGDASIEKKIYHKCYLKWNNHDLRAVDNCSRNEANYYKKKGQLSD